MTERNDPSRSEAGRSEAGHPEQGGLERFFAQLGALIRAGNQRLLLLRNRRGRTVLRLPLTAAVVLACLLLWWATPLVILALLLALVLGVEFVVRRDAGPGGGTGVGNGGEAGG